MAAYFLEVAPSPKLVAARAELADLEQTQGRVARQDPQDTRQRERPAADDANPSSRELAGRLGRGRRADGPPIAGSGRSLRSKADPARSRSLDRLADNPLTARVAVNRLWKLAFGQGMVRTLEDLGSQGEWPDHPELLDWLAVEFMDRGWDVKQVVRLLVTSGTYRQTSQVSPILKERDPFNRLYARQSRFRLDAEAVRDNALAVSGLLSAEIGGPSVKPYQPAGYWDALNFPTRTWKASPGISNIAEGSTPTGSGRSSTPASWPSTPLPARNARPSGAASNIPHASPRAPERPELCRGRPRLRRADSPRRRKVDPPIGRRWAYRVSALAEATDRETAVLIGLLDKHTAPLSPGSGRREEAGQRRPEPAARGH